MSEAYYRKWRPVDWDGVVGQEHIIRTLRNALGQGKIVHAYLFSGPRGTGKTTTARIIAKAVNCLAEDLSLRPCNKCDHCLEINQGRFLDLIEIDAASNTSVDDVRDLREKIHFSPSKGRYKVYIIDEVHMLSNAAFNALLKTLEEPPAHALFVLATTEVYKIPPTVLSRCQRHEFRRIPMNFIQAQLKSIAEQEGIEVESAALTMIARQATGSLRDAISLFDQLASTGSSVTLEVTQQILGTSGGQSIHDLINALLIKNAGSGISTINHALDNGSDPRQLGRQIVDTLRSVLMIKMGNEDQVEATVEESEKLKDFAGRYPLDRLLGAIHAFDHAAQHSNAGWQPGLQLELAVAQSVDDSGAGPGQKLKDADSPVVEKVLQSKSDRPKYPESRNPKSLPEVTRPQKTTIASTPERTQSLKGPQKDLHSEPEKEYEKNDFNQVQSRWKEIRNAAKGLSPETSALLLSARSVTIRKERLLLGFASDLLRSKMENGHNIENARNAIRKVTGLDVQIDCCVVGKEASPELEDLGIDKDGMVGEALSLGGKITKTEQPKGPEG